MAPHVSPTHPTEPESEAWTAPRLVHPGRRTFLLGGAAAVVGVSGVATLAGIASAAAVQPAARRPAVARASNPSAAAPRPTPSADPAPRPTPSAHPAAQRTPTPAWAHRWHAPIYSIDDFEHRSHTPTFAHKAIMLTVDDGPSPLWTPRYLRLFARYGITATFCMIGSQVPGNKALVREVIAHGHVVANHTWTHDEQLTTRSASRIRSEIERTSAAIHAASGYVPSQFRAPGGNWGPAIYAELAEQKLMPLGWNIDPADWSLPGTAAIEHAMLATRAHDIILCHDGGGDRSQTYHALQAVIPSLLQRGYRFVTLPAPQPTH